MGCGRAKARFHACEGARRVLNLPSREIGPAEPRCPVSPGNHNPCDCWVARSSATYAKNPPLETVRRATFRKPVYDDGGPLITMAPKPASDRRIARTRP